MKTRMGFVSNSSSSSFLIYGVFIEDEKLKDYFDAEQDECDVDDEFEPSYYEAIENACEGTDILEYHYPEGYDGYYIGSSLSNCEDDETMGAFKKRVIEQVNKIVKKPIPESEFGYHEEAYYS